MPDRTDVPTFDIIFRDPRWLAALPGLEDLSEATAVLALTTGWKTDYHGAPGPIEVAIIFADDDFVQTLNADYRQIDSATNVLSFPACDWTDTAQSPRLLGDVVLAYETVLREAKENNTLLAAHARHLIVHGILHLLGYDHKNDVAAERMEKLEIMILEALGDPDPYGHESELMR